MMRCIKNQEMSKYKSGSFRLPRNTNLQTQTELEVYLDPNAKPGSAWVANSKPDVGFEQGMVQASAVQSQARVWDGFSENPSILGFYSSLTVGSNAFSVCNGKRLVVPSFGRVSLLTGMNSKGKFCRCCNIP